jgi:hypothetical protein
MFAAFSPCESNEPVAISGNYSHPVIVNGYSCINCAEVAQAKADIDPANPAAGPGGANDPKKVAEKKLFSPQARDPAQMAKLHAAQGSARSPASAAYAGAAPAPGGLVSLSA